MEFSTTILDFKSNLWGLHIPVPEAIATLFVNGKDKRVICTVDNKEQWHAGLMPSKEYWFIMLNQSRCKKNGWSIGTNVSVHLEKDTSEYGMDVPEELQEMLVQDTEGSHYFESLTPGKKRTLIHLVATVKNTQGRINKSLAIVHHLKEVQGNLNFKLLMQTIKNYNQLK